MPIQSSGSDDRDYSDRGSNGSGGTQLGGHHNSDHTPTVQDQAVGIPGTSFELEKPAPEEQTHNDQAFGPGRSKTKVDAPTPQLNRTFGLGRAMRACWGDTTSGL